MKGEDIIIPGKIQCKMKEMMGCSVRPYTGESGRDGVRLNPAMKIMVTRHYLFASCEQLYIP